MNKTQLNYWGLTVVAAVFAAVAALLATVAFGFGTAGSEASVEPDKIVEEAVEGINSSGETYGSNFGVDSPEAEPDLIRVYGDDGELGYVRNEDLNEPAPTLEEVQAQLATGEPVEDEVLPVYDAEGNKQIDTFTIEPAPAVAAQ